MTTHLTPSASLLSELAKPSPTYTRRAWIAMAGLAGFMLFYLLLVGWFLFTAYRLTIGSGNTGGNAFWGWIMGACAILLAAFMLKGFFFVKRGGNDDTLEINAQQQPRLFEFLYALADEAGAPRPHKVFLSARVNAAVFYDLSIINLVFPSKKNLEIGLGLVNVLNLGELRSVLAHEFGHFAQRAMAVGRWVYIAQQIAGNLVARRDKLDDFLNSWSRVDFRIAWVAWILGVIVWSIRSLVDSAFSLVVLVQRALSREMEMQADLVAVSLTGSDALIHALHRLQAADDSWDRALNFAFEEKTKEKIAPDIFALQSYIMNRMALLLNDPHYGDIPALPESNRAEHRVFKAELARPPQMWLTHPLNHEREENAKRRYVAAPIDASSAWDIFDETQKLREQVSAKLLTPGEVAPAATEDLLKTLDKQFNSELLKSCYRGVYYGRSPVRAISSVADLYEQIAHISNANLSQLYPESITQDIEQLAQLEKELGQLRALQTGVLKANGSTINLRGKELKRKELPIAIREVEGDKAALEKKLQLHDKACRSVHLAAAQALGNAWPEYLTGLLAAIHYADHTAANLRDAQGLLSNAVQIATATRKVNDAGIQQILNTGNALHSALEKVYAQSDQVVLDHIVRQRLGVENWTEALGEFKLNSLTRENISSWLDVIDGWVNQAAGACSALRSHALEQLLVSEAVIAKNYQQGKQIIPAPAPPAVPLNYDILLPGQERKRQTKLNWWARFQTADGTFPALARFTVAGGIVAAVLGFGGNVGGTDITIYNGLARTVIVNIAGKDFVVSPFSSTDLQLDANRTLKIATRTTEGAMIESFDEEVKGAFTHFVYNVAAAAPLVEWTSVYGNASPRPERMLGAPRWTTTSADVIFTDPPKSVSTKSGGATRAVLTGLGRESASQQVNFLSDKAQQKHVVAMHARWDMSNSAGLIQWLAFAERTTDFPQLLQARLRETPDDVVLLRTQQDMASDANRPQLCAQLQERAKAQSQNADLHYIADRCGSNQEIQANALLQGHQQWPQNGWYAYGAGYVQAEHAHWRESLTAFEQAREQVPAMKSVIALAQLRITRLLQEDTQPKLKTIVEGENQLSNLLALESEEDIKNPEWHAYQALHKGQIDKAMSLVHGVPDSEMRVLRLAAASVGSSAALQTRALALAPEQGVDATSVWAAIALAVRAKQSYEPYLTSVTGLPPKMANTYRQFLTQLQAKDFVAAERSLDGLTPELRGQAYSMAVVVLGDQAPRKWRDSAKRLLFASERPYLG